MKQSITSCVVPNCKQHAAWPIHPVLGYRVKPIERAKPLVLKPMFTVREAHDALLRSAKHWQQIVNGAQWPQSMKDFSAPIAAQCRFHAWVLSLAL